VSVSLPVYQLVYVQPTSVHCQPPPHPGIVAYTPPQLSASLVYLLTYLFIYLLGCVTVFRRANIRAYQPGRFTDEYRTHYKALYSCPIYFILGLLTYLLTCLLPHNQAHVRQAQRHITDTTADTGTGLKANIFVSASIVWTY